MTDNAILCGKALNFSLYGERPVLNVTDLKDITPDIEFMHGSKSALEDMGFRVEEGPGVSISGDDVRMVQSYPLPAASMTLPDGRKATLQYHREPITAFRDGKIIVSGKATLMVNGFPSTGKWRVIYDAPTFKRKDA